MALKFEHPQDHMARAAIVAVIVVLAVVADVVEGEIGVNWGIIASHPLKPSIVVNMLKDNGIKKVKLFGAESWLLGSLAGSKIETIIGIANDQIKIFANSYASAEAWVKENVTTHVDAGVDIRYVSVGNEPFLTFYNNTLVNVTLPAMQNVQKALDAAGHRGKVKVTTALNADVYVSYTNLPSDGQFRPDIYSVMVDIVKFLDRNKAPFIVNIYPFLNLDQNPNFPVDFAFFDGGGTPTNDKGKIYTNVFDANYDTLVWSLKKVGVSNMKIIVGEIGWPTDGSIFANVSFAKRFYDGMLKKAASSEGTPMKPNEKFEIYLFGLLDEDWKSLLPGLFERHWGIFRFDGKPKFPMDLSGKGKDAMLVGAKGVEYYDRKWCIVKESLKDLNSTVTQMGYACNNSDCTALEYGSSCNSLDQRGKTSYAFNSYYQAQEQREGACVFGGTAELVTKDPSVGSCWFLIQIHSAPAGENNTAGGNSTAGGGKAHSTGGGERLKTTAAAMVGVVLSLFALGL